MVGACFQIKTFVNLELETGIQRNLVPETLKEMPLMEQSKYAVLVFPTAADVNYIYVSIIQWKDPICNSIRDKSCQGCIKKCQALGLIKRVHSLEEQGNKLMEGKFAEVFPEMKKF